MTQKVIRTRFAPSPTGYMHIGNLRTALYAYLFSKKNCGSFILRIEDTDQERYVEGAVDLIYKTMRETGLNYDEGPDIGGEYGPYIQSERRGIYKEYAVKLVDKGEAYYCFCSQDRLDNLRTKCESEKQTYKYDRHCLGLSKREIEKNLNENMPYVIRQKMPTEGVTSFDDAVFGTISINNNELEDQILLKSDGLPTYNFANVVDDHLMNITHIIRGSEYLTSTPKYNLLYKAFGWDIPVYIHASPVMKDANKKLSKREGDASYEDFINKGYLKDAIINYIALLGWSPGGEKEIFSLDELTQAFDIGGISKSPAIFDVNKLNWLNSEYVKNLTFEEFHEYALPYYKGVINSENIELLKVSELLQARTEKFSDIPEMVDFIDILPQYGTDLYFHKKMKTDPENSLVNLKEMLPILEGIPDKAWNKDAIHEVLFALIEKLGVKNGQMLWPLRVALSGKPTTPGGGIDLADILGKHESIKRLKQGIRLLEGK